MKKNIISHVRGPFVLLILDGWGIAPPSRGNAISQAKIPVLNSLFKKYPTTSLQASGRYVGLPEGQPGNSEAGHMNMGAGRIVEQDSVRIGKAINQGLFFKNEAFLKACEYVKKKHSRLHLMGLLTEEKSGHADPDHLLALIALARKMKIKSIFLHLFTDGRDSSPHGALKMVEALMRIFDNELIATISGRFYAMDRNKFWTRTMLAYDAMVMGVGLKANSPQAAITECYNRNQTDEYIPPYVIQKDGRPIATIKERDAVIFFNLRSDRARQLTKSFVQRNFEEMNLGSFHRKKVVKDLFFVAMTDFGPDLSPITTAFPSESLFDTIPMILKDFRQLYIAESEKFAHITYFFNGGYSYEVGDEKRIKIDSPNIKMYDQRPAMSIGKITQRVIQEIKNYDFIAINFANADMIGHSGNLQAAIKAVEIIDTNIGKIKNAVLSRDGILLITADHGNIEKMLNENTNEIFTEHTTNPVPCILVSKKKYKFHAPGLPISAIAPTILRLLNIKKPKAMTTRDLLL